MMQIFLGRESLVILMTLADFWTYTIDKMYHILKSVFGIQMQVYTWMQWGNMQEGHFDPLCFASTPSCEFLVTLRLNSYWSQKLPSDFLWCQVSFLDLLDLYDLCLWFLIQSMDFFFHLVCIWKNSAPWRSHLRNESKFL